MKESNFYSDDFEQLIRDKTEQYKMYPSENVWKGVHNSLHTKRRWFIGGMSVLVTGILFLAGRELIAPSAHPMAARKTAPVAGSMGDPSRSSASSGTLHTPLASYRPVASSVAGRHPADAGNAGDDQDPVYKGINITISNPVLSPSDISEWLNHVGRLPEHAPALAVVESKSAMAEQWRAAEDGSHAPDVGRNPTDVAQGRRDAIDGMSSKDEGDDVRNVLGSLSAAGVNGRVGHQGGQPLERTGAERGSVEGKDVAAKDGREASAKADAAAISEADDMQRINWLRDYAMNILPPSSKRGRTFLQLTLSPTLNYRTLNGVDPQMEKFGTTNTGSLNPSPGLGFEVGGSVLYRVTRNLSVKAGLQFNFIRYQIGTYATSNPQTQSTSYLTPYGYYVDSMRQHTMRQASQNNSPMPPRTVATLDNDYYQLSAPVGFELRVLGNEKLQLHVGATVQPSYLLSTTAYMLAEDNQSYDKLPQMFRRWNVSAGVETFLTYRMGSIRWQVGPEFRYQLFSSYTSRYPNGDQYPISENLKSYGIKFGIVKPLP